MSAEGTVMLFLMLMLGFNSMRQTSNEEIPINDNYAKHAIIDVNLDNSRASIKCILHIETRENSQNGFEAGDKEITARTTVL
jgi:hypothetical protein